MTEREMRELRRGDRVADPLGLGAATVTQTKNDGVLVRFDRGGERMYMHGKAQSLVRLVDTTRGSSI